VSGVIDDGQFVNFLFGAQAQSGLQEFACADAAAWHGGVAFDGSG
jgi:hypothetical protein